MCDADLNCSHDDADARIFAMLAHAREAAGADQLWSLIEASQLLQQRLAEIDREIIGLLHTVDFGHVQWHPSLGAVVDLPRDHADPPGWAAESPTNRVPRPGHHGVN